MCVGPIERKFRRVIGLLLSIFTIFLTGCQMVPCHLEPVIACNPPSERICHLHSSFESLSLEELSQDWGKELKMGESFAREWDLYRAITCFKRALMLIPTDLVERRLQIEYDLLLAYYFGQKYYDVVSLFETSQLIYVNHLFPAFNNLLIILYESYHEIHLDEKADAVLETIQKCSPETAEDLSLFMELKNGSLEAAQNLVAIHRDAADIQPSITLYTKNMKSPKKARILNALLPGAGYYYVGLTKSAVTSFVINTLFTYATYQFFKRGYPAAGIVTASLESGWYLGGINGAGIEAQEFNNRLYEGVSKKILMEKRMFPILMLETSF